jgi:hypothetical protein
MILACGHWGVHDEKEHRMKRRIAALGLILILAVTACSDGGDDTTETTAGSTETTQAG